MYDYAFHLLVDDAVQVKEENIPKDSSMTKVLTTSEKPMPAYLRKRMMRGKNRKVRASQVADRKNLEMADMNARRRKQHHHDVLRFDRDRESLMAWLQRSLEDGTFRSSRPRRSEKQCPCGKTRVLTLVPFSPDHQVHHALMQVLMPVLEKYYYRDTFASVRGRGQQEARKRTERYIDENRDAGRLYYVKLDFVKFYHNVWQDGMMRFLCSLFSDNGIRSLLHEIIYLLDEGLGIGLYPIQPLTNAYTSPMLRAVQERFRVRMLCYCDDMVIIGRYKREVWKAVNFVMDYARDVMRQPLHGNIGMQVIDENHYLDFVGYRFAFGHTTLRRRMKARMKRSMKRLKDPGRRYRTLASYKGWLQHADCMNLWRKVTGLKNYKDMMKISEMNLPEFTPVDKNGKRMFKGALMSMTELIGKTIEIEDVELYVESKKRKEPCHVMKAKCDGKDIKVFVSGQEAMHTLKCLKEMDAFPVEATVASERSGRFSSLVLK